MKHIYLNLKRFDIPRQYGGVNDIADVKNWGPYIVEQTQEELKAYDADQAEFVMYFPEAHLFGAVTACSEKSPVRVGCQGVLGEDTAVGGNFGAFTTGRTANSMKAAGCSSALIGHCEERKEKAGLLRRAGTENPELVSELLNEEIKAAQKAGLDVLYCIGEKSEEQPEWERVLGRQLETGLAGVDRGRVVIAYEPVWSIGPGKVPADREYITKIARFVKEKTNGMDVVYGGGLKADNARMLASIEEIDGGLIALTRFQGAVGFYPEEYLEIIRLYMKNELNRV